MPFGNILILLGIIILLIYKFTYIFKKPIGIFYKWSDSVHMKKCQRERLDRAFDPRIKTIYINDILKFALIRGVSKKIYLTKMYSCSCEDFKRNQAPCKHMYYLGLTLDIITPETFD